jgi:hypothetical protein
VHTTTRAELADHIHTAFATGPATRTDLLVAAVASNARPPLIEILHQLPDKTYTKLRDLWHDLPDLPISQ